MKLAVHFFSSADPEFPDVDDAERVFLVCAAFLL
jgi:hypothetical protein